jgi:acyl carrier protein phosphodiesterase
MNFLAHIYLSGDDPNIQLGNFIGDFVKGRNLVEQFGTEIAKGIELHRTIDEFTDKHPIVKLSKVRLREKYRHYAPVIVDIFYDHYLAKNWDKYHKTFLPDFAEQTYSMIMSREAVLPEKVKWMMPYMIKGNWLANYARIDGIGRVLNGMSRRTPYDSKMDEAVTDLQAHYTDFEKEFFEFFPELENHSREFLSTHSVN